MFLFTTPTPARPTGTANPVVDAVRQGAAQTGTDFDYLLSTAKRESALDPGAKASTSSATGLFQFVDQTWLGLVKSDGAKMGLGSYADAITPRSDGTFGVADPATRDAILNLRKDPGLASVMAGTLTRQNGDALAGVLGRQPTSGELYAAHVLGARGASDLIRAASSHPAKAAAIDFPDAAAANRNIFYDRRGRPRGAGEVFAALTAGQGASVPPADAAQAGASVQAAAAAPGLTGLFQTGGRAGPISDAVAKIWRVNNGVATSGVPVRTASISYFPRMQSEAAASQEAAPSGSSTSGDTAPTPSVSGAEPIVAPLPPSRPRFEIRAAAAAVRMAAPTRATGTAGASRPLDLTSFMKWRRS